MVCTRNCGVRAGTRGIVFGFVLLVSHAGMAQDSDERSPWERMDYGPYLSASIEAPHPTDNVTNKAIAIPFELENGDRYGVMFDTDLLRWSAGWIGDFVKLKGVVYDGIHGVFPEIDGEQLWGTAPQPGWTHGNATVDPRRFPYGPLPHAWARWHGLYVHGENVVLSYSVGETEVLEHPRWIGDDEDALFVRSLHLGPANGVRRHLVSTGHSPRSTDRPKVAITDHATFGLAVVEGRAQWVVVGTHLYLDIAASERPVELAIVATGVSSTARQRLEAELAKSRSVIWVNPQPYTHGGQARWSETLTTRVEPYRPDRDVTEVEFTADDGVQSIPIAELSGAEALPMREHDPSIAVLVESEAAAVQRRNAAPLADGLWGYWPLDEGSGALATDSVRSGRIEVEEPAWRRGYRDRALEFEGRTRAVIVGGTDLDFDSGGVTVSAWIATEDDGTIIARAPRTGNWAPGGKTFFIRDGRLAFDVGWVGVVAGETGFTDGRWHHVAFSYDGKSGRVALYVDGKLDGTGHLDAGQPLSNATLRLGFTSPNFPGTSWLHAKLDELRIYRRALPATEIAAIYEQTLNRRVLGYTIVDAPRGTRWRRDGDQLVLDLPPVANAGTIELAEYHGSNVDEAITTLTRAQSAARPDYRVDRLSWPDDNPWDSWMRFGGFDFFPSGDRAAISTWSGDVWIVDGVSEGDTLEWHRIATGLYQPLGLEIIDETIYVLGRDQVTRLVDSNGDGETDFYENFNNDTQNSSHFHEFAMDLQIGPDGDFYYMKGARHARRALFPQHGTLMRMARDGSTSEILADGLRGPNGLAVGANGDYYTTDQEGHWMPANRINRMVSGGFYGNGWSYYPHGAPTAFDPPICWVHPSIDRSPSSPVIVASDRWSLPRGTLLSLSYGVGKVFQVVHELSDGVPQGAITPLPFDLPTGIMRARFHPRDGQLYVAGLYGWSSNQTEPGGFYRVRSVASPAHAVNIAARAGSLSLTFDTPLAPSARGLERYGLETWNYRWTEQYGSPDLRADGKPGRDRPRIERVTLLDDGRTVRVEVPELRATMQYHLTLKLETLDGRTIDTYFHGTINTAK